MNAFWVGSTYKFEGMDGNVTIKFLEDKVDYYNIRILSGTGLFARYVDGYEHTMKKTSKVLTEYQWTRIADDNVVVGENDPVVQKIRKRRTSDEVAVDDLIEYVQRDIKMKQLWVEIDKALENGHVDLFVRLSKEYTKLKSQQTQAKGKVTK